MNYKITPELDAQLLELAEQTKLLDVAYFASFGKTNQETANGLRISKSAVDSRWRSLRWKTGARSKAQAVYLLQAAGLIE